MKNEVMVSFSAAGKHKNRQTHTFKNKYTYKLTFLGGEGILGVGAPCELVLDLDGCMVVSGRLKVVKGVLHAMHQTLGLKVGCLV